MQKFVNLFAIFSFFFILTSSQCRILYFVFSDCFFCAYHCWPTVFFLYSCIVVVLWTSLLTCILNSQIAVFCSDHCCFVFCILRLLYFVQIIVDRGVKDGLQALLVLSVHSHLDVSRREHWAEPSQWQRTTTLKDRLRWSLRLCYIFKLSANEKLPYTSVLSMHSHLAVRGREHWAEPSQWQRTTSTWKASYCLCISYMLHFRKQ